MLLGGIALLLALFGAIFWGVRYSSDKNEHIQADKIYQMTSQNEKELHDKWFSAVTNEELEVELEDRIAKRDAELVQEIRDTWTDYYDGSYPEFIVVSKETYYRFIDYPGTSISNITALRILMANRGFLTKMDAEIGMTISIIGTTELQKRENYAKQSRFVQAINEKLGENKRDMYVDLGDGVYHKLPTSKMFAGRIKWRPMVSIFDLQNSERMLKEMEAWR